MNCPNCSRTLGKNETKCTYCGEEIEKQDPILENTNNTTTYNRCPICGSYNEETQTNCSQCGQKLQIDPQPNTKYCPNCHNPINQTDKYCRTCGKPTSQDLKCPNCHSPIKETDKYCRTCGKPINPPPYQETNQEQNLSQKEQDEKEDYNKIKKIAIIITIIILVIAITLLVKHIISPKFHLDYDNLPPMNVI